MVPTCVDFALEELQRLKCRVDPQVFDQLQTLEVHFGFLNTLLLTCTYTQCWRSCCHCADKGAGRSRGDHFGYLINLRDNIESSFGDAMVSLRLAFLVGYETRANNLNPLISNLLEKIEIFKPNVGEAYDYLFRSKDCCFLSNSPVILTVSHYNFWDEFVYSLWRNLEHLQWWKDGLTLPVKESIRSLQQKLSSLRILLHHAQIWRPDHNKLNDLLTYLGAVLFRAAYLSYLCWVNKMDQNMLEELLTVLPQLQQQINPNTPEFIEMYLDIVKGLKLSGSWTAEDVSRSFLDILLPANHQIVAVREGLIYLIRFFITTPLEEYKEDVEQISRDITAVAKEAGSLSYSFQICESPEDMSRNTDPSLSMLLQKIELLKAEITLIDLLKSKTSLMAREEDHIEIFHNRLSFSIMLLINAQGENRGYGESTLAPIQDVGENVITLFCPFCMKEVSEDRARDSVFKLSEKIKLLKAETFLMEMLNSNASPIIPENNRIKILQEGLGFLRKFLVHLPKENPKDWKLILKHTEALTRGAISFYYSFAANKVSSDMVIEMGSQLSYLLKMVRELKADVKEIYFQIPRSLWCNFPKTNGIGFIHFLLENLRELQNHKTDSISFVKNQIEFLIEELTVLRSLLLDIQEQCDVHQELRELGLRVIELAYEVEYAIGSILVRDGAEWYDMLWLSDVLMDLKLIKVHMSELMTTQTAKPIIGEVAECLNEKETYVISLLNVAQTPKSLILPVSTLAIDEVILDLPDQSELIIDRLTRGSLQQDIISIVGMPGIGKTTLAKKVYNEPSIMYHFHKRAWVTVSQSYKYRNLLIDILSDIEVESILDFPGMEDEDLEEKLFQSLKGKRYVIVMDDVWEIKPWNELQTSLPDDHNQSRILITTRHYDVAQEAKPNSSPHTLRLLKDEESWELLQKKLFDAKECPKELLNVGWQISKNCEGLPLAVVAIAGLLKGTDDVDWWAQVSKNLSSIVVGDPRTRCMDILDMSYKHLPDYLKPCFLHLGSFMEDKEIPVSKLKRLWIGEGFIQKTDIESLEDVAEKYLVNLISRSLVMVSKKRSRDMGPKACRVHDMLRDLCLARCKDENFAELVSRYDDDSNYGVDASNTASCEKHRLSICSSRESFVVSRPCGQHVRSLLFFATSDSYPTCPYDVSFISGNFKLLKVLDIECINMGNSFPRGIESLVLLRYLAVSGHINFIPSSIENLRNLETLFVKGLSLRGIVALPESIWSMKSLRHVHVNSHATFSSQDGIHVNSCQLDKLVTFSSPSLSYGNDTEKVLRRLPNLQKLSCIFSESKDDAGGNNVFPVLGILTKLESLKILYSCRNPHLGKFEFPLNLKKLTLSNFRLPWKYVSEIGKLPNLEVLKLLSKAFEGETWDMKEGEFQELKFLKLDSLSIAQWKAAGDQLPKLQRLVLRRCKKLEEVPSGLDEITTLEVIEVQFCKRSVEESVKRLKENVEGLKVIVNLSDVVLRSSP